MKIVAKTDIGMKRASNQDSYATGEFPGSVAWAVVCDGMGGVAGGNVASSTAVKIISDRIASSFRAGMSAKSIKNMLISAITAANLSVYDISRSNDELYGMGTTVVTALVSDGNVCIAHAGDSRAYILSDQNLRQLTKDHSVVQEMVDTGELTPDEAKEDPRKNLITRALGIGKDLRIDFCVEPLNDNDVLLLCTDGLTNYIEPEEIYELTNDGKFYEYPDRLVARANENGGGDNITIVTVSY